MHRICHTLATNGFDVTLVGRELKSSVPVSATSFKQERIRCRFNKGFLFYAEYNLRLFLFLIAKKMDGLCAIDLDTILPTLFISGLKSVIRIYDAHEYFTELKEVRTRPAVQKVWKAVERFSVPKFQHGYTVSGGLAQKFAENYNRHYAVIQNLPLLQPQVLQAEKKELLLYQGAVNEGRGFEYLIPALKKIGYPLVVCGDGNFMPQLKKLVSENAVEDKVTLTGMLLPAQLRQQAARATLGIALAEKEGINQYHALPNKFLEYIHAGLPQIAMNYPEYRKINATYKVAVLVDDLNPDAIADIINRTMQDKKLLQEMAANSLLAREVYCWQNEEKKLLTFYNRLFS